MTTLNIESKISHQEISLDRLITSNNMSSYNFINASVCVDLTIDGAIHSATLQTGHSYHHGDYSLPSNTLSIYEGCELIEKLDQCSESELEDQSTVDDINETAESNFSSKQLIEIYYALVDVVVDAQSLVSEAEIEADENLEKDNSVYVLYTMREKHETFGDNFEYRQCEETYPIKFDSTEEAEGFIEEKQKNNDLAHICDKDTGVSSRHKYLSNF